MNSALDDEYKKLNDSFAVIKNWMNENSRFELLEELEDSSRFGYTSSENFSDQLKCLRRILKEESIPEPIQKHFQIAIDSSVNILKS